MTRTPILISTLLSFTTLCACGGGDKQVQEPAPAPEEEMPAEPEPMVEEAPAEPPPEEVAPAEPPPPEPKTLSEDLDGDGTPEEISLAGTELSIGEAKVTLAADKITPDKAATIELKVIDINKKDKARELVIVDAGAEGAGTWWVIAYDGKTKTASEPVEMAVAGEPEVKGNGKITVKMENCGETTTTTYSLRKGVLTGGKPKKKGKYDEAKCAG